MSFVTGHHAFANVQATIAIPKKGNAERRFRTVHKKYDTDFPPKSEPRRKKVRELKSQLVGQQSFSQVKATTEASLQGSHSLTQEDACVNINTSQYVAKLFFFSVGKRKPSCPYKLWDCATDLTNYKYGHQSKLFSYQEVHRGAHSVVK